MDDVGTWNQQMDYSNWVGMLVFANKNIKEIHERTEVENTIRVWLKILH